MSVIKANPGCLALKCRFETDSEGNTTVKVIEYPVIGWEIECGVALPVTLIVKIKGLYAIACPDGKIFALAYVYRPSNNSDYSFKSYKTIKDWMDDQLAAYIDFKKRGDEYAVTVMERP